MDNHALTDGYKAILRRLESTGKISWQQTTAYETRALNTMTANGLCKYNYNLQEWTITQRGIDFIMSEM